MAAGFANALMFISLMLMNLMVGFLVIAYVAHCFLLVIEDTAAGNDEVIWPDEPLYDWIMKGFYLVSVVAIWLAPLGVLARILKVNGASPTQFLSWFGLAIALLWLMFPISILSAMSSQSRWILLRWHVVWNLSRIPSAIAVLYLVSGLMLLIVLSLAYFASANFQYWVLLILGPLQAFCLLVYGRLIGRVGWLLQELRPKKKKKISVKTSVEKELEVESTDPWKGPPRPKKRKRMAAPEPTPDKPSKLPVDGYAVSAEELPKQPMEIPLDGYAAIGYETVPVRHDPEEEKLLEKNRAEGRELPTPSALQMKLAERSKPQPPPPLPLVSGIYSFPFYNTSLQAFGKLGIGLTLTGGLFLAARAFLPW
jgi:hypothetical protein